MFARGRTSEGGRYIRHYIGCGEEMFSIEMKTKSFVFLRK
jgi:hypothetical protein